MTDTAIERALTSDEAEAQAARWVETFSASHGDLPSCAAHRLTCELAAHCVEESLAQDDDWRQLDKRMGIVFQILHSLEIVACPVNVERDRPWRRRDPAIAFREGYLDDNHFDEDATWVVRNYLEHPWLCHPMLDKILLDMLLTREIVAFGDTFKRDAP